MAKSIDIMIPYNAKSHMVFLECLQRFGTPLATMIPLNDGDLIAIEVEVSDPERSAPRNVEANHCVGIALNVVATLPKARKKTIEALRTTLPPELHAKGVVIDALQLLQALRGGAGD